MKKLLQINSVVNTGSTGRIAEEIGILASAKGYESYIAYGRYGNPSKSQTIKIGNRFDTYWHVMETKLFDRHGLASKRATNTLLGKIEKINPDVVHLHNLHGYYVNIQLLFDFINLKSIPVVWTLHDCWPFTGHCTYFESIGCEKWKTECNHCPLQKTYPSSMFTDRSKANFDLKKELFNSCERLTLVPVSNWLNGLVKKSFLQNIPTEVIHNGLDLEIFNVRKTNNVKKKYNLGNNFVILGVASLWGSRKGLNDFLELSKILTDNERIILVGLTKNQHKMLPNNMIGIEKTESITELCEFYSVADVFVNPTYEDNFPTTNIEALACGTPVITYDTGGSPEAVSEETGFVVEQGNINDLLARIKALRKSKKESYSMACRARAKKLFDKNIKYQSYLDLYDDLISS